MNNILVKLIGYPATILHGDPAVFDRWRWLKRHIKGGRLKTLDAGCGSGAFAMYATKNGNETTGISFDDRNNKVATVRAEILNLKNIKFIKADLRKLDEVFKEKEIFDQIICFETIEHILDDKKLIKDFFDLLKPGGKLFLTVPYKHYKRLLGDKLSQFEDGGHVRWGYTHEEMTKILSNFGFRIEVKEYITGYMSQKLIYLGRLIGGINSKLAWILIFPFRIFQFLDPILAKLIKYPFHSIGIIAAKPHTELCSGARVKK